MYSPKPFVDGFLPEKDGHKVYYACFGNPGGLKVISLHGGPGSHSKAKHAAEFDLDKYQVIVFDQRGCGKSTPNGELQNNTTQHLVDDIERLRRHLGIDSWFVAGGSWGSTLTLVYAETHPEVVKGIMASAIFLGDNFGLTWFSEPGGVANLFPDVYEKREMYLEKYKTDRSNLAIVMLDKIREGSEEGQKDVAADLLNWETNLMSSQSNVSFKTADDLSEENVIYAKVFLHYEADRMFLEEGQILKNIATIQRIPMLIVHGRYDVLCPFKQAWDLHQAHGNSRIIALPESNHSVTADGAVARKLAFESFLKDFS